MSLSGESGKGTRHRRLSRDEIELWHEVTRSVVRLPGVAAPPIPALRPAETGVAASPVKPAPAPLHRPSPGSAPAKPRSPALAPFDPRLRRALSRGHSLVDDAIDLHGLHQAEAHHALRGFLAAAQSRGAKVVLIITGKGLRSEGPWPERTGGVLYRAVPQWLSAPEFRRMIVGFEKASAAHGGDGALYVRLRRADRPARPKSPAGG